MLGSYSHKETVLAHPAAPTRLAATGVWVSSTDLESGPYTAAADSSAIIYRGCAVIVFSLESDPLTYFFSRFAYIVLY